MDIDEIIILAVAMVGIIPLVGILLGYLHAFYWPITFIAVIIISALARIKLKNKNKPKFSIPLVLAVAITVAFFIMMSIGASSQKWLEDDDPYGYAVDAYYVAHEHTTLKDKDILKGAYLEPDPPGYAVFMAFFYQITGNMVYMLKLMNVVMLTLGILCSYFFFKEFMQNEWKAVFATLVLAAIPSFLTRFVFATALAVSLFFPALYCIIRSKDNPGWIPLTSVLIANILVIHHLSGFAFGCFYIIYLLFNRDRNTFMCGLFGVLGACLFWVPNLIRYGISGLMEHFGLSSEESAVKIIGSATRAYTVSDFFSAPSQNLINTSTGWGPIVFILVAFMICLVFTEFMRRFDFFKDHKYLAITLLWFVLAMVAVNAYRLPFMLMPFRWWTFLAIPVAILTAESLYWLYNQKGWGMIAVAILIILIILTSWYPKWQINAHPWNPSRSLTYPGLLEGHLWLMDNLPKDTHVYTFNQGPKLPGFNMYFCAWCKEDMDMENQFMNISIPDAYNFISNRGYDYLVLNLWYYDRFGKNNATGLKMNEFASSEYFNPVFANDGMVVLEVR